MKRIFIILAFLPLFCFGQVNNVALKFNDGFGQLNGGLWYFNTLGVGQELILKASSISEDSLTYNSSGDLVTGSSGVNVDLDGSSEVVIGNSVRFGTPGSGIIYQVVDTGATAANLVLDQTFTGSVTDEYYWGGINTWYDESGKANHVYQTTAINQPKLLFYNTDSATVNFDGINDYMDFSFNINIGRSHTIISHMTLFDISNIGVLLSLDLNTMYRFSNFANYRINGTSYEFGDLFDSNIKYKTLLTRNGITMDLYVDGVMEATKILSEVNNVDFNFITIGKRNVASSLYFNGNIDNVIIYTRVLSSKEIEIMSK